MYACRFCDAGTLFCSVEDTLYRMCGYVVIISCPVKQPHSGAIFSPALSQMIEGRMGQDGVTVIAPLALSYPHRHPFAVDIGHLKTCCFAYPQPR